MKIHGGMGEQAWTVSSTSTTSSSGKLVLRTVTVRLESETMTAKDAIAFARAIRLAAIEGRG